MTADQTPLASLEDVLAAIGDPTQREAARVAVYAEALDRMFAGCDWLNAATDPHRRTPVGVIADVDRVMESLASHSVAARHIDLMVAELERRRRRGFGLVWDAESPDNAERLRVPVKDLSDPTSCGLAIEVGVVVDHVDSATDLYQLVGSATGADGAERFTLQPWEPRTGNLAADPVVVSRDEISHVVHLPYDRSTATYPILAHRETISHQGCPDDAAVHTIVEGENFHALQALLATHRGMVDVIYIDPPYNTGNQDFAYNDRFVSKDDDFRHSSWLRFMERRLRLAKQLLTSTGVLVVAIGDDEHHQLRLLLDQVMDANNFISDVVWNGGRKNDSRFVSNGADYMLIFGRDVDELGRSGVRWRERKQGLDAALNKAEQLWSQHDGDVCAANADWKAWLKAQKLSGASTDSVNRYDQMDPNSGRPINTYGNITWPGGGGKRYEVMHPTTGRPVKQSARGWLFTDPMRMQEEIDAGRVWFGPDETTIPRGNTYLDEMGSQVPLSVFEQDRKATNTRMREMLGDVPFSNPKDVNVIGRWLGIVGRSDATILDFFAGSGSTLQAVAELNRDDGGSRRCILVTNNTANDGRTFIPDAGSDGICQKVTIPRTRAVLETGYKNVHPIMQRCEVFKLDYLHGRSLLDADSNAVAVAMPNLWVASGLTGQTPVGFDPDSAYVHPDGSFAVLPPDVAPANLLKLLGGHLPRIVWVLGDDEGSADAFLQRHGIPSEHIRHQFRSYKHSIDQAAREAEQA